MAINAQGLHIHHFCLGLYSSSYITNIKKKVSENNPLPFGLFSLYHILANINNVKG